MTTLTITPREGLKFGISKEIPRYWFAGDPFRTRLFDADSVLTPCAEKLFINCVRAYRDDISDPVLRDQVSAFIRQEGQHSRQHAEANNRLIDQGIDIDAIDRRYARLDERLRSIFPRSAAIAVTAANEYLTAVTARAFMENAASMQSSDLRIFALYAWHCAEELEHRSVCFDVMQKVAGVGYIGRITAMLISTPMFSWRLSRTLSIMLKADGFSFWRRIRLMFHGCAWMYGQSGLTRFGIGDYLAYFKPGFHPSTLDVSGGGYGRWKAAFDRTGDPIQAAEALR